MSGPVPYRNPQPRRHHPHHSIAAWRTVLVLACALLLVAMPATVRAQAGAEMGAESPQALLERARAAGESEDFGAMASLVSPEDRAMLTMTMIMMMGMVMAFSQMGSDMAGDMAGAMGEDMDEAAKAEMEAEQAEAMAEVKQFEADFEGLLQKYGLDDVMESDEEDPAKLMEGVDQVGLLQELMALMDDLPGQEGDEGDAAPQAPMSIPEGELEDLQMDGDTATATLGGEPVEFVRVDGRWYLSLGLKDQMQESMGAAGMEMEMDADEDGEMAGEMESEEMMDSEDAMEAETDDETDGDG